jgi:hypothetical protein
VSPAAAATSPQQPQEQDEEKGRQPAIINKMIADRKMEDTPILDTIDSYMFLCFI